MHSSRPATHQSQTHGHPRPGWVFTVGRAILRPYLKLRHRPLITGLEHVPQAGPVLFTSNHLSSLDTILIPSFAPRKVQFLAKSSLFSGLVRGSFMRSIGAIPVYREAGSAAQAALDAGKRVLESGGVFAVFPEGSRSRTGDLHRGRTGAAWLALETGATIVPVGLIGTNRTLTPRTRMEVRFGEPVSVAGLKEVPGGRARRELTERIMSAIADLSGQQRVAEYSAGSRDRLPS